jgi:endonuclease/exonuclease/phosphatase family metal-dependent hydrolase
MKLRVLTYNIHKCIGGIDRRYRPERVAEVIGHYDPDILLLQEVDNAAKRSSRHSQVDLLAELLEFVHHCWYPNVKVRGGGHHGNAILSRFPLVEPSNIDITTPPKKKRGVVHTRHRLHFERAGGKHSRTLHLFNMHLGLSQIERKIQLARWLESHPFHGMHHDTPIIVGGDLNDVYGNLGTKLLEPAGFRSIAKLPATFPSYAPVRALDGLYVRGNVRMVKLERSRLKVARQASDHLPLIADLIIT